MSVRTVAIERQIQQPYDAAQAAAERRLRRSMAHVGTSEVLPETMRYYERVVNEIADDLSKCGKIAGRLIGAAVLVICSAAYKQGVSEVGVSLQLYDVTAIFHGRQLKTLPGYKGAFEQIRLSKYYFGRAIGRLGDDKIIVGRLREQLAQSIMLGESTPQLAARVKSVTKVSYNQAVRIARTECSRAYSQGKMLAMYQAIADGIPVIKRWHAMTDDKVRDTHQDMHGETVEPHGAFSNGMHYPLDPNGNPEEVINCRCHLKIEKVLS